MNQDHPDLPYCTRRWRWWRDAWFSYQLAHEPSVRGQSFDQTPPTPLKHLRWCRRLVWGKSIAWVLTTRGTQVGQVRYDWKSTQWVVSVALLPIARGFGLASWLLTVTAPDAPVLAEIKWTNDLALRTVGRAGYKLDEGLSDDVVARMVRSGVTQREQSAHFRAKVPHMCHARHHTPGGIS